MILDINGGGYMVKITLLRLSIYIIGVIILALCIFWLPDVASYAARENPEYAYLRYPVLFGLYFTTVPFYFALYQSLKLLRYIKNEHAFSEAAYRTLGTIQKCAITIMAAYLSGSIALFSQNALHPGIAIVGLAIIFATIVISVFSAVLQELLKSALELKDENDLTV